ncbi:hypothetical protein Btru_058918 [Bulinus truncatus]|nr:hypothetical protein Btru_058918 [Bulinus truncatus]
MEDALEGTNLFKIYQRVLKFREENPNFAGTMEEMVSQIKRGNVVGLLSSPTQDYLREKYIPELVSLKDVIFKSCAGFILPRNSELENWISNRLQAMTDSGLIDKLRSSSGNFTHVTHVTSEEVDVLTNMFQDCQMYHVAIFITSMEYWPVHWILSFPSLAGIQITHYNIGHLINRVEALSDLMREIYISKQARHFVIVSSEYNVILDSVHRVFYDRQRGEAAVLPHKTTFTLIVPSSLDIGDNLPSMVNSTMDNIAVFVVNVKSKQVSQIFSLMYRENRRREWESIHYVYGNTSYIKQTCRIFPNRMYGLNGRKLNILAKDWIAHMYRKFDINKGKLQYAGFYANVINALSETLNFTINFIPEPGEDNNITWSEFSNRVGFGEVDIGATTYMTNSDLYYNHSASFPILWSNVSGIYVNRERTAITSPLKLFQLEVYICLSASLIFTMFLYLFLTNITSQFYKRGVEQFENDQIRDVDFHKHHSRGKQNVHYSLKNNVSPIHSQHMTFRSVGTQTQWAAPVRDSEKQVTFFNKLRTLLFAPNESINCKTTTNFNCKTFSTIKDVQESDVNKKTTQNDKLPKKAVCLVCHRSKQSKGKRCHRNQSQACDVTIIDTLIGLFFKFIGSIFSQDSLPEPDSISARILLWCWCLMLLVITAIFTGNITANLVDFEESVPFTTFEELLQRTDYKWGLFQESSFYNVMKNSKEGTILRKLYDKMELFALTDPFVKGKFDDQIEKLGTEKYVTFFFTDDLEYLKDVKGLNHIVILKDSFMISNMGFIFPKTSALNELISKQLLLMTDVGILDHLYRSRHNSSRSVNIVETKGSDVISLDMFYLEGLFYCCGLGLAVSGVVLVLECLCAKCWTWASNVQ